MEHGGEHADIMEDFEQTLGVPAVWRDARLFTGNFQPSKLRFAWRANFYMAAFLIFLLVMDYLTLVSSHSTQN